jgi:hypothetical protein
VYELLGQHLERHLPAEAHIHGTVDDAHPAATDLVDYLVVRELPADHGSSTLRQAAQADMVEHGHDTAISCRLSVVGYQLSACSFQLLGGKSSGGQELLGILQPNTLLIF